MSTDTTDTIREQVRERYAAAARGEGSCCGPTSQVFGEMLYDAGDADGATEAAVQASLGCGVPTAVADLHAGETVLDLGSGAGADVLISARRVGPAGRAIGLDMTDEMLELARRNAAEAGAGNVEFLKGTIEDVPLPDASVDVVISNCVINLSGDKDAVLREAARVLRPGGRFAVSDVIADPGMDAATRADMAAWTGCIAGALTREEFERALVAAGSSTSRSPRRTASTSRPPRRSSARASPERPSCRVVVAERRKSTRRAGEGGLASRAGCGARRSSALSGSSSSGPAWRPGSGLRCSRAGSRPATGPTSSRCGVLGVVLIVAGLAVVIDAFVRFARDGLGTPSPMAPPRELVVTGAYRHVRNPMYIATAAVIVGEGLLLRQPILLVAAAVYCVALAILGRRFEEPLLRRRFGPAYDAYHGAVPAWRPRIRRWRG